MNLDLLHPAPHPSNHGHTGPWQTRVHNPICAFIAVTLKNIVGGYAVCD